MKKGGAQFVGCMAILAVLAIIPLSVVFSGYALSILWGWFIVTTFHLPPLTIPQAIGVSIIVGKLTSNPSAATKEYKTSWGPFAVLVGYPALSLAIGWIVRSFL